MPGVTTSDMYFVSVLHGWRRGRRYARCYNFERSCSTGYVGGITNLGKKLSEHSGRSKL